ncbi:MAG TPA: preprotein translocase subunit YajC [Planctomycetota bacterium]|nr:preprotein translocase subunit YajC [Planctomycetota bacterium]
MPSSLVPLAISFLGFLAQATGGDAPPPFPGDDGGGSSPAAGGGGGLGVLLPFIVMAAVMWLFLIKPQKTKENEEKALLDRLKKNDHVVTKGGLHGVVMNVKDDEVVLRIDEQQNVKVRFQKNAIAAILGEDKESNKAEEKKA